MTFMHGRMTEMTTRRAVYEGRDTVLATIRLKAKNVSALRNSLNLSPRKCSKYRFILRSFWCNSVVSCSGEHVYLSVGRYLALF